MFTKNNSTPFILGLLLFTIISCNTTKKIKTDNTVSSDKSTAVKVSDPPIIITPKEISKILYIGVSNPIQVHTRSGNTQHLEISAPGCIIDTTDSSKGLYKVRTGRPGLMIELVAKNKETNELAFATFEAKEIPAPIASIGIYRQPFKTEKITSTNIKLRSAIILNFATPIPYRCAATSFDLTRIDMNGKRETINNQSPTGIFEDKTQELINKAQKGDIYIFSNILNNCSKKPTKDIVYILQN